MEMDTIIFCRHKETRSILVQTMDNSGPQDPPNSGQVFTVLKQPMNQSPGGVARSGVHNDARRFVQYNQGSVFINRNERYRFRFYPIGTGGRDSYEDDIARPEALASLGGTTIDLYLSFIDECLGPGSGQAIHMTGNEAIEPIISVSFFHRNGIDLI